MKRRPRVWDEESACPSCGHVHRRVLMRRGVRVAVIDPQPHEGGGECRVIEELHPTRGIRRCDCSEKLFAALDEKEG